MPIYEYRCQSCGHELDKLQKMSDSPLIDCPACGKPTLKKLISASGFRLSGSGWYETDFKQGSKRNIVDDKSSATEKPGDSSTQKSTEIKKKTAKDSNNKASNSQ
jgi:putative FmdB family regulatory protein